MEADDGDNVTKITQKWRWKKVCCGGRMYEMNEGEKRQLAFKI